MKTPKLKYEFTNSNIVSFANNAIKILNGQASGTAVLTLTVSGTSNYEVGTEFYVTPAVTSAANTSATGERISHIK